MNPIWNIIAGPIFESFNKLIDHFFPDANKAAELKEKMAELQISAELEFLKSDTSLALAQADVDKTEAGSGNWFAAGWRPSIGYICALSLFYNFIVYPMMLWIVQVNHATFTPPPLFDSQLMTLVLGMLGLGTMRSIEKVKGVA